MVGVEMRRAREGKYQGTLLGGRLLRRDTVLLLSHTEEHKLRFKGAEPLRSLRGSFRLRFENYLTGLA